MLSPHFPHAEYFTENALVGSSPHSDFTAASFLLPLDSVTLNPIRLWAQRYFYADLRALDLKITQNTYKLFCCLKVGLLQISLYN